MEPYLKKKRLCQAPEIQAYKGPNILKPRVFLDHQCGRIYELNTDASAIKKKRAGYQGYYAEGDVIMVQHFSRTQVKILFPEVMNLVPDAPNFGLDMLMLALGEYETSSRFLKIGFKILGFEPEGKVRIGAMLIRHGEYIPLAREKSLNIGELNIRWRGYQANQGVVWMEQMIFSLLTNLASIVLAGPSKVGWVILRKKIPIKKPFFLLIRKLLSKRISYKLLRKASTAAAKRVLVLVIAERKERAFLRRAKKEINTRRRNEILTGRIIVGITTEVCQVLVWEGVEHIIPSQVTTLINNWRHEGIFFQALKKDWEDTFQRLLARLAGRFLKEFILSINLFLDDQTISERQLLEIVEKEIMNLIKATFQEIATSRL